MSYYNDGLYFGLFQLLFDEISQPYTEHQSGCIWLQQIYDSLTEKYIFKIQWHLGNNIYEDLQTYQ